MSLTQANGSFLEWQPFLSTIHVPVTILDIEIIFLKGHYKDLILQGLTGKRGENYIIMCHERQLTHGIIGMWKKAPNTVQEVGRKGVRKESMRSR